ncbi:putative immunity protein [Viridibacillus sp. NPDC093762]
MVVLYAAPLVATDNAAIASARAAGQAVSTAHLFGHAIHTVLDITV